MADYTLLEDYRIRFTLKEMALDSKSLRHPANIEPSLLQTSPWVKEYRFSQASIDRLFKSSSNNYPEILRYLARLDEGAIPDKGAILHSGYIIMKEDSGLAVYHEKSDAVPADFSKRLSGGRMIFDGLVHRIYLVEDKIYKTAKDAYIEFHSELHFLIERAALNLLVSNGIPTPFVYDVVPRESTHNGRAILVEEYVKGIQKSKPDLSITEEKNILSAIRRAHRILLPGYGYFGQECTGSNETWQGYLEQVFSGSIEYIQNKRILDKKNIEKAKIIFSEGMAYSGYEKRGSFLFIDINPGNIFFSEQGKIKYVIDIDHPAIGDPIYDFACLKWYNPSMFSRHSDSLDLSRKDTKKIQLYELIQGLEVIRWMHSHGLETEAEVNRVSGIINVWKA